MTTQCSMSASICRALLSDVGKSNLLLFALVVLLPRVLLADAGFEEKEIEKTYIEWTKATDAKDIEQWSSFLAPDPFFLPPGSPPLQTREAVLDYYRKAFADPNFSLDCQQQSAEIADSGGMAWAQGICHATFTDADGKMASGDSRWMKVWIKQGDGSWKCRVNTWNFRGE